MSVTKAEFDALLATLTPSVPPDPWVLRCSACLQPLDAVHADLGTHPQCDPEPAPSTAPRSTIAELRSILIDYEAASPRSTQDAIGPSEIAVPCDRRLAYRIRSTPLRLDGRVKWAPLVGTAVHTLLAAALEADNARSNSPRWLVEHRVHPDPAISGSCDAYDTVDDIVVDWKVVGPTRLEGYRRKGPGPQYEGQIQLYGRGWQRAGRNPKWVRIVFLPRSTEFDDAYEWTAPYSRPAAEVALERLYSVIRLLTDLGVDETPALWGAIPATPGPDCRFCPYYRRGGPPDNLGCPGDVAADVARDEKFTEGLIAS